MKMIEDLIRELIEALKENTAVVKTSATHQMEDRVSENTTQVETVVETVVEKPKRKPRRTKKQIAEDKAQAEALASGANSVDAASALTEEQLQTSADTPTPQTEGRTYKGHPVPSGVAVGMEEDWFSVSGLVDVATQPQLTLNDVRTQMTQLAASKGGGNVVNCIAKYAARIDLVAPEQYQSLLDDILACPDINSSAPPPPA